MQNIKLIKEDLRKTIEAIDFSDTSFEGLDLKQERIDGNPKVFTHIITQASSPCIEIVNVGSPVLADQSGISTINASFRVRCIYEKSAGDQEEIEDLLDELTLIINLQIMDYLNGSSNWDQIFSIEGDELRIDSEFGIVFKDLNLVAKFEKQRQVPSKSVVDL